MIYLDNAATSFPKPEKVINAVAGAMRTIGANPGRAGHTLSLAAGRVVWNCREEISKLINNDNPELISFGFNCTDALNLAIFGCVKAGDHVITTMLEHNSALRPINGMVQKGLITWSLLAPGDEGYVSAEQIEAAVQPNTKLIVVNHVSNVTGIAQPVVEIGKVAAKHGVLFLVDGAQSLGMLEVDVKKIGCDMLAFPGHKGLLGPMGTGGLYIREGVALEPFREGGTGSSSESMIQPDELPEAYESGTLNAVGIAGLLVGTRMVNARREAFYAHEKVLGDYLWNELQSIGGVKTLTNRAPDCAVVPFNVDGYSSGQVATELNRRHIGVRGGLHCAPAVHTHYGTINLGAARASVGISNTKADVDALLTAVMDIARNGI
ncbi:MAG: aminotransferase class V-fold PLP-dependent enzyme [Oscillospiraceae bacterium]|jgi:cysteine desulfurase family protein|nr:aminotransferase class V-fold PLP-dependent enzyme [Oscillospiraceae bacterium]